MLVRGFVEGITLGNACGVGCHSWSLWRWAKQLEGQVQERKCCDCKRVERRRVDG